MIIKIIDEKLINKTGEIVQEMSGIPKISIFNLITFTSLSFYPTTYIIEPINL